MRKMPLLITTLALAFGGTVIGLMAQRPAAHAAPAPPPSAGQPPANLAEILSGKLYPNTIKRDELAPAYHFITLIDAQGNPAICATKGDMQTFGGETFLVAYRLPDAPPRAPGATDAAPALPDARLILVNMHSIQAIGGIRDMEVTPTTPPATPTPGAAPTVGTAMPTPGTAAP